MVCAWRNYYIHCDLAVDWLYGVVAGAVVENSDDGGMCAHHRTHDAAFGAAIGTSGDDIDQHAIAVHGIADGVRRDENIAHEARLERRTQRTGVGDDEAEAVAVHGEAADDQVFVILVGCGLRQSVAIGIELNQFSCGDQLLEMRVEISAGFAVQAEFAHELLESGSTLGLEGDVFQYGGVGKHGYGRWSLVVGRWLETFNRNLSSVRTRVVWPRLTTNDWRRFSHHVSPPPRGGHAPNTRRIIAIWPTW